MSPNALIFHSCKTLENWDFDTPLVRGIGGSETSHVELAKRTGKLNRFPVLSYAPIYKATPEAGPGMVDWYSSDFKELITDELESSVGNTWLVYRDPEFFNQDLPKHNVYWFMAQDVGYSNLTPEQAEKIDRYICLCPEHAKYTAAQFPFLKDKIYLSSNGVRTDLIEEIERDFPISRNPKKMLYASCPERGLELILENWFRIREAVPEAELTVAYGFNNVEKVIDAGGRPDLAEFQQKIQGLLKQPGITATGRINQIELYKQWFSAGIWFHPTSFPETSCITCMDAQTCGAIPVCNDLWALKQNVFHGLKYPGVPQKDSFLRSCMIRDLIDLLQDPERQEAIRKPMMREARSEFNWNRFAEQLAGWHEKDHARKNAAV